jgi:hypothetical protein
MSRRMPWGCRCRGMNTRSRSWARSQIGNLHGLSIGAGHDSDRYTARPVPLYRGSIICVYSDDIRLDGFPGLMMAVGLGVRWLVRMSGWRRVCTWE